MKIGSINRSNCRAGEILAPGPSWLSAIEKAKDGGEGSKYAMSECPSRPTLLELLASRLNEGL
jgi:hypothetical protein